MPYYAMVDLAGANAQRYFTFSFPYLDASHIHVYSDGTEVTAWTFSSEYVVRLDEVLAGPHTIRIQRITPIDAPIIDYQNGSSLNETDLDSATLQVLYVTQEQADYQSSEQLMVLNSSNNWDAQNHRIINVGTPTGTTDAATKAYVDSSFSASGNGHAIGAHVDSVSTSLVKGDLLVVTDQGAGVYKYDKQAIGINGQVLLANSIATTSMSWSNVIIDLSNTANTIFARSVNYQTEINLGALGIAGNTHTITDANCTAGSFVTGQVAYTAPTGKELDELDMDAFDLKFAPGAGVITLRVTPLNGLASGNLKINYHIG